MAARPLIGCDIFDCFSETAEWNSTKLDNKQDLNVLYNKWVFRADRKNKMTAPASDWLRHFRLLLCNLWTEFNETWQEAKSQRHLQRLCFSCWSEKRWSPCLLVGLNIVTSSLKLLKGIQRNLTRSKMPTSSIKRADRKNKMTARPLIGRYIFNLASETAYRNSTKLDRE